MKESHVPMQAVTLSRSLVISEGSVMWKVILVPKGSTAPPDFTCTDSNSVSSSSRGDAILTQCEESGEGEGIKAWTSTQAHYCLLRTVPPAPTMAAVIHAEIRASGPEAECLAPAACQNVPQIAKKLNSP